MTQIDWHFRPLNESLRVPTRWQNELVGLSTTGTPGDFIRDTVRTAEFTVD